MLLLLSAPGAADISSDQNEKDKGTGDDEGYLLLLTHFAFPLRCFTLWTKSVEEKIEW